MFDGGLTFQEIVMGESLPLGVVQAAVVDFLEGRTDVALFGAQAVNLRVGVRRNTEDVALLSPRAEALAEEMRAFLATRFGIAVRVREVKAGVGYRVYQVRKEGNRHLVDVRQVDALPPTESVEGVPTLAVADLLAMNAMSYVGRRNQPKSGTDWRDIAELLLAFPHLKARSGPVRDRLVALGARDDVLAAWDEIVAEEILPEDEDAGF